jgi:hypothetical protein
VPCGFFSSTDAAVLWFFLPPCLDDGCCFGCCCREMDACQCLLLLACFFSGVVPVVFLLPLQVCTAALIGRLARNYYSALTEQTYSARACC